MPRANGALPKLGEQVVPMNLFDRVPSRIFSALASPGRQIYADILFILYDLFRQMRFGIPREVAADAAAAHLEGQALTAEALARAARVMQDIHLVLL